MGLTASRSAWPSTDATVALWPGSPAGWVVGMAQAPLRSYSAAGCRPIGSCYQAWWSYPSSRCCPAWSSRSTQWARECTTARPCAPLHQRPRRQVGPGEATALAIGVRGLDHQLDAELSAPAAANLAWIEPNTSPIGMPICSKAGTSIGAPGPAAGCSGCPGRPVRRVPGCRPHRRPPAPRPIPGWHPAPARRPPRRRSSPTIRAPSSPRSRPAARPGQHPDGR